MWKGRDYWLGIIERDVEPWLKEYDVPSAIISTVSMGWMIGQGAEILASQTACGSMLDRVSREGVSCLIAYCVMTV